MLFFYFQPGNIDPIRIFPEKTENSYKSACLFPENTRQKTQRTFFMAEISGNCLHKAKPPGTILMAKKPGNYLHGRDLGKLSSWHVTLDTVFRPEQDMPGEGAFMDFGKHGVQQ